MNPELLQEVPSDFSSNWIIVPVPSNCKRCLLISSRHSTVVRLQDGTLLKRFQSLLPCGSKLRHENLGHFCVLDSFYHEPSETFFVLDLLVWKGQLYYECETEFRFFWKTAKIQEMPELGTVSEYNQHPILLIPSYEATPQGLKASLEGYIPKEALLFYNKQTHYHLGITTPLVCYLPVLLLQNFFSNLS